MNIISGAQLISCWNSQMIVHLFYRQVSEFSLCVKTDRLHLVPQGVLIVWVWEWLVNDTNSPDASSSSEEDNSGRHHNPHIHTDTESESESEFVLPLLMHTVTFKYMEQHNIWMAKRLFEKLVN